MLTSRHAGMLSIKIYILNIRTNGLPENLNPGERLVPGWFGRAFWFVRAQA